MPTDPKPISDGYEPADAVDMAQQMADDDMGQAMVDELEHHHKRPGIDPSKFNPDDTEGVHP